MTDTDEFERDVQMLSSPDSCGCCPLEYDDSACDAEDAPYSGAPCMGARDRIIAAYRAQAERIAKLERLREATADAMKAGIIGHTEGPTEECPEHRVFAALAALEASDD